MELGTYVEAIRRDLAGAAAVAGEEAAAVADRLIATVESSVRLALLDALSSAAGEITVDLAPGSVEVRLRGREPEFVVTTPPAAPDDEAEVVTTEVDPDDDLTARITLRLPESLKGRIEDAAARERTSVNGWLVRVLGAAVSERRPGRNRGGSPVGHHRTGWVR